MTIDLTHRIEIEAPAPAAWALVADYARDVEWRTGVTSMVPTPAGLAQVGTTTVERIHVGGRTYDATGEVIAVEPGRSFRWRTTSGPVASGRRTVEELTGGRSAVVLELHLEPQGRERLLAPLLRRMVDRNLRADVRRLADLVGQEREVVPADR